MVLCGEDAEWECAKMNLWHVDNHGRAFLIMEDKECIIGLSNHEKAQQICDNHNAWVILQERGWTVRKWSSGKWGNVDVRGGWPNELLGYDDNAYDTPMQAILAADAWLKEREGK
jgi:hypothetical protein